MCCYLFLCKALYQLDAFWTSSSLFSSLTGAELIHGMKPFQLSCSSASYKSLWHLTALLYIPPSSIALTDPSTMMPVVMISPRPASAEPFPQTASKQHVISNASILCTTLPNVSKRSRLISAAFTYTEGTLCIRMSQPWHSAYRLVWSKHTPVTHIVPLRKNIHTHHLGIYWVCRWKRIKPS